MFNYFYQLDFRTDPIFFKIVKNNILSHTISQKMKYNIHFLTNNVVLSQKMYIFAEVKLKIN